MAEAEQAEVASLLEAEEHALSTIDLAIENVRHDDEVTHSCLEMPLSFSSGGIQIAPGPDADIGIGCWAAVWMNMALTLG
jgi:hypothetical protein